MYYPMVTPPPLEFGVAFHKALELYYTPETWHDKETSAQLALVAFKQTCDEQFRNYKKLNGEPSYDIIEDYSSRVTLGLNMLKYYFNDVAPSYDRNWTPVEVEVPFEVAVIDPSINEPLMCKCNRCRRRWTKAGGNEPYPDNVLSPHIQSDWQGLPVTYGGRIDAIFEDEIKRLWLVDWKSASRILDEDKESSFLQLDDQITSYAWALWTMGIKVAGFVYVEFKKAYPRSPELLARPYKGKRFSTNKQFMTTPKLVKRTVSNEDYEAYVMGYYDDYLTWLQDEGPKFTQRHQIHRNETELRNAGINIALECMDIVQDPRIYPQPGRFSCPTCLFQQPCISANDGGDPQYLLNELFERREKHYYETESPSTE